MTTSVAIALIATTGTILAVCWYEFLCWREDHSIREGQRYIRRAKLKQRTHNPWQYYDLDVAVYNQPGSNIDTRPKGTIFNPQDD